MPVKVYTNAYLNAMAVAQAYALGGLNPPIPLDGAKLGLFRNHPTLSINSVLADLTPAAFSGYAELAITWDATTVVDPEGFRVLRGVTATPFQSTGPITPDLVNGYFIENAGATVLYAAAFFDTPINITAPAQIIQITLFARPNGNGGVDSVIGP